MGFESPNKSEALVDKLASLKSKSLDLSTIALTGKGGFDAGKSGYNEHQLNVPPGKWNENLGVIVYADKEGKIYAVPASEEVRQQLQDPESGMERDTGIGVPHLGNADVWGTAERRKEMSSFDEWKRLVQENQEREKAIAARHAAEAREVFGGQGTT